jgi:hypothetical protein
MIRRLAAPGHLSAQTNARQALGGTLSTLPSRSLVSRTITVPAVAATSTHSPPLAPE